MATSTKILDSVRKPLPVRLSLVAYLMTCLLITTLGRETVWVRDFARLMDWPMNLALITLAVSIAASTQHETRVRQAWGCIAAAFFCLWITELVPRIFGPVAALTGVYLLVHPLFLIAWLRLQRVFDSRSELLAFALDAIIVVLGMASVLWVLFLEAAFAAGRSNDPSTLLLALGYPIGDLVLLFCLATIFVRRPVPASRGVYLWLTVAICSALVGDLLWTRALASGSSGDGLPTPQLLWLASRAAIIMAAWHQRSVPTLETGTGAASDFSILPYGAAILGAGILLIQGLPGGSGVSTVLSTGITLLALAVLGRLALRERQAIVQAREHARRESDVHRDALLEHSADAIIVLDAHRTLRYFNPGFERMLGRPCAIGDRFDALIAERDRQRLENILRRSDSTGPYRARLRLEHGGTPLIVEAAISDFGGSNDDLVVNLRDITEQLFLEEQLSQRMLRDPLTGLPNRALFNDRVAQALSRNSQVGHSVAELLLADLDRFKLVNDTRGHAVGDRLLVEAARRLREAAPSAATVARAADDEFAILLEGELSIEDLTRTAEAVRNAFDAPFELIGDPIAVSASVGIAGPSKKDAADELIRKADVAMTQAKAEGRNRIIAFEPRIDQALGARAALLTGLRQALSNRRIDVAFQPIYDTRTNQLYGLEALARWVDPERGRIAPGVFIAVAEDGGLMQELGALIFDRALEHASRIERDFVLSVNISAQQLDDHGFSGLILNGLKAAGWPPERLLLEMTESVIAEDRRVVRHNLNYLRDAGVRIAIDDFGTGYSSLSQLHQFPVDVLKIDRGFIDQIETESGTETVRAVIAIGRALGLDIIAEGVEDENQLAVLRSLDCHYIQGFLFGQPLFADDLQRLSTRVR